MSLTFQLDRYLSVRRSLGYDLSTSERILRRFTRFADAKARPTSIRRCSSLARHAGSRPAPRPERQGSASCACSRNG